MKYIIREVPAEDTDFSFYFDDDGLKEVGGDFNYNLFIIGQTRNVGSFNKEAYDKVKNELENLLEMYVDIRDKTGYQQYPSVGAMLFDHKVINSHNTFLILDYIALFEQCCEEAFEYSSGDNFERDTEEMIAKYLTIKTGKIWRTERVCGYFQGDVVELIYCVDCYPTGVKHYGEVWLGCAKEFGVITLDENGEEDESVWGFVVANCQARNDEEYKELICEWACIPVDESMLEMVDGQQIYTKYSYRTV